MVRRSMTTAPTSPTPQQTKPPQPAKPAVAAAPPPPKLPLTMKHTTQPGWGVGLVVQDLPLHWILFFEHGGEKKFVKAMAKVLEPVKLEADELAALQARAHGRKPKAGPKPSPNLRTGKKPAAKKTAALRFPTFAAQVALFEQLFVGGFQGDKFVKEERGAPGATGEEGYKEAAIALAKEKLSLAAFGSTPPDELFKNAQDVLAATNIVFPIEGPIPFRKLEGEDRAKAMAGLKDVLHGAGDYAERLERFAASIKLKDSKGEVKKVTWPLATVFGGLFDPKQHTCVKPTAFAGQAATLGLKVEKSQALDAAGYKLFLEVATKTQQLLVEAGHQPRDLMDVYTFIWRTHAEKPAAV